MFKERSVKKNFFLHFEWLALGAFLIVPAFIDPEVHTVSYCLFQNIGIEFCPGCGLGRSVAYIYRANLTASFQMHPAGLLMVMVLVSRIIQIFTRNTKIKKKTLNEKDI
jgi:hypothetical protein